MTADSCCAWTQLHHDAEERFEISPLVDGRHIVVNPPELLLEHGAATLGLDLLAALGRGNQLDGHRPAARRNRLVHGAEPPVGDRALKIVFADRPT